MCNSDEYDSHVYVLTQMCRIRKCVVSSWIFSSLHLDGELTCVVRAVTCTSAEECDIYEIDIVIETVSGLVLNQSAYEFL